MLLKIFNKRLSKAVKRSFSQCGEDIIVEYIFNALGIDKPSYLDVGAFHPYKLNNTALFYLKGARGVSVEPNCDNHALFLKERKADTNLNVAVAESRGELMYYQFDPATMNTLSSEDARKTEAEGFKLIGKKRVPTDSIGNIINTYLPECPQFLSLDVEGYEDIVLDGLCALPDLPLVICAETVEYSKGLSGSKNLTLIDSIIQKGYRVYSDTHINTIFLNQNVYS